MMASAIAHAYYRRIKSGKTTLEAVQANPNIGDDVKREVAKLVKGN